MPVQVAIKHVLQPRFLVVLGALHTLKLDAEGQEVDFSPVRMEVYTGWVVVSDTGFSPGPGHLFRDEVRTFLPTEPGRLRAYPEGSLMDHTVTAAPAAVNLDEDEATLFAIDQAKSVALEPQHFDASNPDQEDLCLVLRLDFAALNVSIHRFTYQVTLLFDGDLVFPDQTGWHHIGPLPDGTRPE